MSYTIKRKREWDFMAWAAGGRLYTYVDVLVPDEKGAEKNVHSTQEQIQEPEPAAPAGPTNPPKIKTKTKNKTRVPIHTSAIPQTPALKKKKSKAKFTLERRAGQAPEIVITYASPEKNKDKGDGEGKKKRKWCELCKIPSEHGTLDHKPEGAKRSEDFCPAHKKFHWEKQSNHDEEVEVVAITEEEADCTCEDCKNCPCEDCKKKAEKESKKEEAKDKTEPEAGSGDKEKKKADDSKKDEVKSGGKKEEFKKVDSKKAETKKDGDKSDDGAKKDDAKKDDAKKDDAKKDEAKKEEAKSDDKAKKKDDARKKAAKSDVKAKTKEKKVDFKADDTKAEAKKSEDKKAEEQKDDTKSDSKSESKPDSEPDSKPEEQKDDWSTWDDNIGDSSSTFSFGSPYKTTGSDSKKDEAVTDAWGDTPASDEKKNEPTTDAWGDSKTEEAAGDTWGDSKLDETTTDTWGDSKVEETTTPTTPTTDSRGDSKAAATSDADEWAAFDSMFASTAKKDDSKSSSPPNKNKKQTKKVTFTSPTTTSVSTGPKIWDNKLDATLIMGQSDNKSFSDIAYDLGIPVSEVQGRWKILRKADDNGTDDEAGKPGDESDGAGAGADAGWDAPIVGSWGPKKGKSEDKDANKKEEQATDKAASPSASKDNKGTNTDTNANKEKTAKEKADEKILEESSNWETPASPTKYDTSPPMPGSWGNWNNPTTTTTPTSPTKTTTSPPAVMDTTGWDLIKDPTDEEWNNVTYHPLSPPLSAPPPKSSSFTHSDSNTDVETPAPSPPNNEPPLDEAAARLKLDHLLEDYRILLSRVEAADGITNGASGGPIKKMPNVQNARLMKSFLDATDPANLPRLASTLLGFDQNNNITNQEKHAGKGEGKLKADAIWSQNDCALLEQLHTQVPQDHKWLHMQAEFYNYTGRMIDARVIEEKFRGDGVLGGQ